MVAHILPGRTQIQTFGASRPLHPSLVLRFTHWVPGTPSIALTITAAD